MKTIFIILDGAADLPCNDLNGRTPFGAASKPFLDKFSKNGQLGLVQAVGKGIAPESDVAVFALLGYDPYKSFSGRGPLEAFGAGIKLNKNFLAFRTNFATVEGNILVERRAGRNLTTKEAKELENAINKSVKLKCKFKFLSTVEHRGVLVLYDKLSSKITNVDPAYSKEGNFGIAKSNPVMKVQECMPLETNAEKAAALVNDFVRKSREVLLNHPINLKRIKSGLLPANIILPRDAGNLLPKLKKKKNWNALVGMPLEIGIAKLSGMKILKLKLPEIKSRDIYGHVYESLNSSLSRAVRILNSKKSGNFYLHVKETDLPGHDGYPLEKKKMIELIDKNLFAKLNGNFRLIVTSDHSTPCSLKAHSSNPVPILAYGFGKRDNLAFSESNAVKGSLGLIYGKDLLNHLLRA